MCKRFFGTPSRFIKKHAQSCCVRTGSTRVYAPPSLRSPSCVLLHFASCFRKSPPPPPNPLFERYRSPRHPGHATERTRGPNSSTGKKESKRSLCTKFISCKDFNIYMFSLSIFFSLHKCKIHAFTFPQVQPHPILCRIALFFFLFFELHDSVASLRSVTSTLHKVCLLFPLFFFFYFSLLSKYRTSNKLPQETRLSATRKKKKLRMSVCT